MAKKINIKGKKTKQGLLTSGDIMKGFTRMSTLYDIWTLAPIQCICEDEKTEDWIKWNADWFENLALRELPKKAVKLQKNYNLAQGVINRSDYIYAPGSTDNLENHLNILKVKENEADLMTQFFPIIPNIINVFLGEFLRRDTKVIIDAVDPESITESLEFKKNQVTQILEEDALMKKQIELAKLGLIPTENMEEEMQQMYMQEMENAKKLANLEVEFKKFRTIGAQWGQHFLEKYISKNYFQESLLELYADSLIADEVIMALNLHDDNFEHEVLQPMKTYVNISPSKTYYSESNCIVHVDFMSIPDIINKFKNKLTEEQVLSLENQYNNKFTKDILFADQVGRTSTYWETDKSYEYNSQLSANIREKLSDETIQNFVKNSVEGNSLHTYTNNFNNPKLIRVSRIWWPSQRKVGLLTKFDEEGQKISFQIDENYKVTEKPEYDTILTKDCNADNLISGEHVDWKWINEWRYVIKIGENRPYYTIDSNTEYENIYIGGERIRFQFKGDLNEFDARPPVEGRRFSNKNSFQSSLVDKMKPWQIMYNIVNNRVSRILPFDYGKVLVTNKSSIPRNSLNNEDGLEPLFEFLDNMRDNKISIHDDTIENMEGRTGRQIEPRVLDLSVVEQASLYLQMGIAFKQQAFESIGVSQERLSQIQASQSATGVQQAVEGSVNQTEIYFDPFLNQFLPRVYEMILSAGQFYTATSESFSDTYINKNLEKIFFSVLGTDLLLRDLIVQPVTTAATKTMMEQMKRLVMEDNTMGLRFLDKAKTLISTNPSEVFEQLEKAERQRMEEEEMAHQREVELQNQRDKAQAEREEVERQNENEKYYAKLANDKEIAMIRSMGYPGGQIDSDNNQIADVLEVEKFRLESEKLANDIENKKNEAAMKSAELSRANNIEREKMQIEREKMANDLAIAQENKNSADLQFQQLRKDKKEQAKNKKS
jgi:hypothetical protein